MARLDKPWRVEQRQGKAGPSLKSTALRLYATNGARTMKRVLLVGIICLSLGHTLGMAQKSSPYQTFGDLRSMSCWSWTPAPAFDKGYTRDKWWQHAPEHAWTYGFIAGAGYMPPVLVGERLTQIDVRRIDAWMDRYCATHRSATVGDALLTLIQELDARR
jgi:hypothetical protein